MKSRHASLVVIAIGIALVNNLASAASWEMESFQVSGDIAFSDDFTDGFRNAPPTNALLDFGGSQTSESGGVLVFSDADGIGSHPFPGIVRDSVVLNQPVTDSETGGITITGEFVPRLADVTAAANDFKDGYGIFFTNLSGAGAWLSVGADLGGIPFVSFQNDLFTEFGRDLITGVTGNIVLELSLDQGTDLVRPRYSVDGGTSFIDYSSWDSSSSELPVTYGASAFVPFTAAGAFGQTAVPVPAALPLLAGGLGLLGLLGLRRRRSRSGPWVGKRSTVEDGQDRAQ